MRHWLSTGRALVMSAALAVSLAAPAAGAGVEVAPPPLAWSSWNAFMNSIDARVIEQNAHALVSSGLAAAGYRYVNIDEGWWQGQRDAQGDIVVDRRQWPGGMSAVVRRIHALGLKAGIYTDAGRNGCGYYYPQTAAPASGTGSEGHYLQDFVRFARWGFDYVKVDWCGGDREHLDPRTTYAEIAAARARAEALTGRHLVFSICEWGRDDPWVWGPGTGDLWRVSGDISYAPNTATFAGILRNADINEPLAEYQHNGRYNDPDMMEVGAAGLSEVENRVHLGLWAVMGAPMILGDDLRALTPQLRREIANRSLLAVDQDRLGLEGYVVSEDDAGRQVWAKTLTGRGRRAVVLLNRGVQPATVTVRWADLGLADVRAAWDVWAHRAVPVGPRVYTALVRPHGSVMLVVRGDERAPEVFGAHPGTDGHPLTFGPIPSAVDGFTVARLRFSNATNASQTMSLADDEDPASVVTVPPTAGRERTLAVTLSLKPGANSVSVTRISDPKLRLSSLSVTPRPVLPARFDAAGPSSELSGGARRQACSSCPGKRDVGLIGSGQPGTHGVLTMHVRTARAGRHLIGIWYVDGDIARTFELSVNGGPARRVTAPSTFSWSTVGSVRVTATLTKGDNTLRFSNPGGRWAPDIAAAVLLPRDG